MTNMTKPFIKLIVLVVKPVILVHHLGHAGSQIWLTSTTSIVTTYQNKSIYIINFT